MCVRTMGYMCLCSLLIQYLFQPSTYRFVVQFEQCPGYAYGYKNQSDVEYDMMPCGRILVCGHPCHLHIHQWIMRDVERVGEVAKRLTLLCASRIRSLAAYAYQYDDGEHHDDGYQLIESVGKASLAAYLWHGEEYDEHQRCPPKSTAQSERTFIVIQSPITQSSIFPFFASKLMPTFTTGLLHLANCWSYCLRFICCMAVCAWRLSFSSMM